MIILYCALLASSDLILVQIGEAPYLDKRCKAILSAQQLQGY